MSIVKYQVVDNRIAPKPEAFYPVYKGSTSVNTIKTPCVNPTSQNFQFSGVTQGIDTFMSDHVQIETSMVIGALVTMTANASNGTQPLFPLTTVGSLCAYPFNSMIGSYNVMINGKPIQNVSIKPVLPQILRLIDQKKNYLQTHPAVLDTYLNYNDASGSSGDSLGDYSNSIPNTFTGNGCFSDISYCKPDGSALSGNGTYTYNSLTTAFINGIPVTSTDGTDPHLLANGASAYCFFKINVVEPLLISPFKWFFDGKHDDDTMHGIREFTVTINFDSAGCDRIFRYATDIAAGAIANIMGNRYVQCSMSDVNFKPSYLVTQYLSPNAMIGIPEKKCLKNYFYYVNSTTDTQTKLAPGTSYPAFPTQTLIQNAVPQYILLWVKPSQYEKSYGAGAANIRDMTVGDYCYPIDQISITGMFNENNLMLSFTREQLYQMTVKNGIEADFNVFKGMSYSAGTLVPMAGFPILIKPSVDFYLGKPEITCGEAVSFNMTINVTCHSQRAAAEVNNAIINVCQFYSGFLELENGDCQMVMNPVKATDALERQPDHSVPLTDSVSEELSGGNKFMGSHHAMAGLKSMYNHGKHLHQKGIPSDERGSVEGYESGSGKLTAGAKHRAAKRY